MKVATVADRFTAIFISLVCFTAWIPLAITVGGLNLRISEVVLPLTLAWLFVTPHKSVRGIPVAFISGFLFWLFTMTWTAIDVESSAKMGRVFLLALNMLHAVAIYGLMLYTGNPMRAVIWFIRIVTIFDLFVIVVAVAAGFGIILFPGFLEQEAAPVLADGQVSGDMVMRFSFGGVLAGVISVCVILLCLTLLFYSRAHKPAAILRYCAIAAMGMAVSFSRQAVVSLAIGIFVFVLYSLARANFRVMVRGAAIVAAMCIGFWIVSSLPGADRMFAAFAGRVYLLFDERSYHTGTVSERERVWTAMMEDIKAHPFVGLGQDSYLRYMTYGEGSHNFPLEVWHTSGLFGFLAFCAMHVVIIYRAVKRIIKRPDYLTLGLLSAFLAAVASSFTNLIAMNPLYWLLMGMLAAATKLAGQTAPRKPLVPVYESAPARILHPEVLQTVPRIHRMPQ